jgi:membrane-associated protein
LSSSDTQGIFAAVFLESGVFFGFFLPGSSMLFTAGLLATQGLVQYLDTDSPYSPSRRSEAIAPAIGSATRSASRSSSSKTRDSSSMQYLEQAKDFYEKHGVLAVILARFIPIVRTFAPIVAGIANMRYRTFLAYNVVGGFHLGGGARHSSATFLGSAHARFMERYITPIIARHHCRRVSYRYSGNFANQKAQQLSHPNLPKLQRSDLCSYPQKLQRSDLCTL